jgi:hypothetical protein
LPKISNLYASEGFREPAVDHKPERQYPSRCGCSAANRLRTIRRIGRVINIRA